MIKKHEVNYSGMSKDLSSDLQSDKYFDAKNIRILATDQKSSFAVTNEVGNELIFTIPTPSINSLTTSINYTVGTTVKSLVYKRTEITIPGCELETTYWNGASFDTSGTQVIIGTKELRDSALIVTTDDAGFDCFWELTNLNNGLFDLNLLYMGNLSLSKNNLVQVLFNYENSVIQKIYFIDGVHQLRFLNIRQSIANGDRDNLIDLSASSIDTVSTFVLSQPLIDGVIAGGSHTSGMVQYAYGLYILNGAQTTISPPSILVPIDKGDGLGGGEVNEVLGRSVQLLVPNIDSKFTHIKVYSIKYTSYNENPEINIVVDKQIDNYTSMHITDDGTSQLAISLESFVFLGSSPIVPQHITTKDNRLFPINIKESNFIVNLDMRAYSFNAGGTLCQVLDNPYLDGNSIGGITSTITSPDFILNPNHDAVNKNYDTFKYTSAGTKFGGTGKYVNVEVWQTQMSDDLSEELQFLKDRELYRLGIKFYNRRGQTSDPKWMMDLRAPEGNVLGNYNQLKVTLTSAFYVWLNDSSNFASEDDKPVGYKILRADRTLTDQTIHSQGFINPMVANLVHTNKFYSETDRRSAVNHLKSVKPDIVPSVVRLFETITPINACKDYWSLSTVGTSNGGEGRGSNTETFTPADYHDYRAQNFQHNRLMQFYSPEVLFRDNGIDASYKLKIVGLMEQSAMHCWAAETNPVNAVNSTDGKFINGITGSTIGVTKQPITGDIDYLFDWGLFGPANSRDRLQSRFQIYREFNGAFRPASVSAKTEWDIYGSPELTNEGSDFTTYNNDSRLRYSNNLKTMRLDDLNKSNASNVATSVYGCNTIGAKCITFAEGKDEDTFDIATRFSIERIHQTANIGYTKGVLLAEFVKDFSTMNIGNIYGGMSYESKANSSYIEIGTFTNINTTSVFIDSPGDTFVNKFTFTKLAKDDTEIVDHNINIAVEIVSIRVETTIDLKNRNDLSLNSWENRWLPKYSEYQKYNKVYSQQPSLIKSVGIGSKVKKIQEFDGRLMASKEKIPGEFIDSWTDFLENEIMDLDGKFGPINAVVNLKDEIFCLQDTGVAHIAVNPRVQVPGSDGVSLELGTGGILHDYKYISTTTGCLNRWGTVTSENAFYFVDLINKGIMVFDGAKIGRLSDAQGFHHELLNRMNYESLVKDNAVLGNGVSLGYNPVNSDVYFTFVQETDSFTLGFNEKVSAFVSYYDYKPAWYINKGSVLISTDQTTTSVWEHFKGQPNSFYGTTYPSSITLHIAPEGDEIILNGASYKLEMTKNGVELPLEGLTAVRVYNDYQDSGLVPLVMRQNVFKKFRNWKLNFPRQINTRERVRSAWGFAEFEFTNPNGKKLILHDITIFYTQH